MAQDINNREFFEKIIQNYYNDSNIKIIDYKVNSGIGKGENYASEIFRAQIHWQRNNLETGEEKLVIKIMPEGKLIEDTISRNNLFEIENRYYTEILPMYKSILISRGIENYSRLAPTYLKCNNQNLVIMKDLAPLGFRLGDRQNGGDFDHCLLLLKALARNQALSIALSRKVPGFFDDKTSKLFVEDIKSFDSFYSKPLKEHIETLEQWPEFQEFHGRIQPKSAEEILKIVNTGDLKAICQGDCWMNNMLFRYDETTGKPEEVCLIDYQIYFWGSLAYDVIYFMHSSVSPFVLEDKKHILIDKYIDEFHKWMKDLGEDLGEYTRENILKDFKKLQYFGVILVLTGLYLVSCGPEDALSLEKMTDQEGKLARDKLRNNPFYKKKLLKHLQIFARENII